MVVSLEILDVQFYEVCLDLALKEFNPSSRLQHLSELTSPVIQIAEQILNLGISVIAAISLLTTPCAKNKFLHFKLELSELMFFLPLSTLFFSINLIISIVSPFLGFISPRVGMEIMKLEIRIHMMHLKFASELIKKLGLITSTYLEFVNNSSAEKIKVKFTGSSSGAVIRKRLLKELLASAAPSQKRIEQFWSPTLGPHTHQAKQSIENQVKSFSFS